MKIHNLSVDTVNKIKKNLIRDILINTELEE
jgi:hypothetical protein